VKKNILITGGAGFVGANLAIFLQQNLKDYSIMCLDNLSRKGSSLNVARLKDQGIQFIEGDVRDKARLEQLTDLDVVIDCAADPSVLAAYDAPRNTTETNLMGTLNCLEVCREHGAKFIFISSSRVYPIESLERIPFEEQPTRFDWKKELDMEGCSFKGIDHHFSVTGSRSLYGTTKLCSELLAQEYFQMFGIQGVINRCGLIAGPWQMGKVDQGVVSYWMARHKYQGELRYIGYGGSGKQVRDALHIDDVCALILQQILNIEQCQQRVFNIGGGRENSFSLCELTAMVKEITNREVPILRVDESRKADVRIYITDNSLVTEALGWQPEKNLKQILLDINHWIDEYSSSLTNILL